MHILLTGVLIGFFTAIFASMYSEYFFNLRLPLILIYGVIGPFLSALAVLIIELARKSSRTEWERQQERRDGEIPEKVLAASEKWVESGDEEKRRRHEKENA